MPTKIVVQKKISELTKTILSSIPSFFEQNELAYITLQSKNELQIRDKFAWKMQCELDKLYGFGSYVVRREWSKQGSGRKKVDLAILEMNDNGDMLSIIALMEFKAHYCLKKEKWPMNEFPEDVSKMKNMIKNYSKSNIDLYFIFLQTSIGKKHNFFKEVVTYKKEYDSNNCKIYTQGNINNYTNEMKKYWDDMFYTNPKISFISKTNIKKSVPIIAPIGISFGYDFYISSMIWGPVKASAVNII